MREIFIDGSDANGKKNLAYRGFGMVSGNNSSRLLLDYKAEHEDAYFRLLEYIFGDDGLGLVHLKLEMGSDINSSSGTEPCVKRFADEKADVSRGAGFQLAADAKKINPSLSLDMLWWSEPAWVSGAEDVYAARYRWYKESLDAAYELYGLKFDFVSVVQNERAFDIEWVKYFASHLKSEKVCPYDYAAIKIIGADEEGSWNFADVMLDDVALRDVVDVVGSHYTSASSPAAQKLADLYGKELWFSEGCPPMNYAQGRYASRLSGINGSLDIANRIIAMYPWGKMSLYEFQPVVASYYDGACFCQKQLISAFDPWSGFFMLDCGFFMSLHFSQFFKKGWSFLDNACYCDGKPGADSHTIVDAVYSYMSAVDPISGDYSTVICNSTCEPIEYFFKVKNVKKASSSVGVWETRGPDRDSERCSDCGTDRSLDCRDDISSEGCADKDRERGTYDENYFKKIDEIYPEKKNGVFYYKVVVKPFSIVTVSTVVPAKTDYKNDVYDVVSKRDILLLPYSDDFEYSDYPDNYLSSRGYAPRYTTDQGGAFEVEKTECGNVLVQQITPDLKAKEWGWTPEPVTCLGDDRWYNYSVSADIKFSCSDEPSKNYAGIGLRYTLGCNGCSGYWLQLFEDGKWKLNANNTTKAEGRFENFDGKAVYTLKITAVNDTICAYIDGKKQTEYTPNAESLIGAGRAAFYSSFNRNSFDNLLVEPIDGTDTYVSRFDDTDFCFVYDGEWEHNTMSSFKNYKRTISKGKAGASVSVSFEGTGFAIFGETEAGAVISVKIDENEPFTANIYKASSREISFRYDGRHDGLKNGFHTAKITVISGEYCIDGMQVPYNYRGNAND